MRMAGYKKSWCCWICREDSEQVAIAGREIWPRTRMRPWSPLHVVEFVPVEPMGETLMPTVQIEEELHRARQHKLSELSHGSACRAPARGWKPATSRRRSCAWRRKKRADLIVLGSRERHGLAILVNFTEDTVLHAAHCDVLAVRLK